MWSVPTSGGCLFPHESQRLKLLSAPQLAKRHSKLLENSQPPFATSTNFTPRAVANTETTTSNTSDLARLLVAQISARQSSRIITSDE
jgi:hypothetical protein